MSDFIPLSRYVILDACCIINIASTHEFRDILKSVPMQMFVSSYVLRNEVISYISFDGQEIDVRLDELVNGGLLSEAKLDFSKEEEANYIVSLEDENLDPGEAESAAIAINRGWSLATDDKRAINVVGQVSPTTQIVTTPELIKCWCEMFKVSDDRIRQVIKRIRRYTPPKNHPLLHWWQNYL